MITIHAPFARRAPQSRKGPRREDGGRTRTRTWDPLIKSLLYHIDNTALFLQLHDKHNVSYQWFAPEFPTAPWLPWQSQSRHASDDPAGLVFVDQHDATRFVA